MADDTAIQRDHNWDFDVNLSGLVAPTGRGANLPEGYYQVKLTDMYTNPEKPGRVIIKMTISDGPFTGMIRTTGLNKPTSPDDKVRYYWRGLAESAGYAPSQLDAGQLRLGAGSFVNRNAHIYYKPAEGEGTYEDCDFLPPADWNLRRQGFESTGAAQPTGNAGAAAAQGAAAEPTQATSLGGGGDGTTKAGVLEKLGMGGGGGASTLS